MVFTDYMPFWTTIFNNDNYFGIIYVLAFAYVYQKKDFYLLLLHFLVTIGIATYFFISYEILLSLMDDLILLMFIGLTINRMNESKMNNDVEETK
jgi:hypothetical protein